MTGPKVIYKNEFDRAALDTTSPWLPPPPVEDSEASETRGDNYTYQQQGIHTTLQSSPLQTQVGGQHYKKMKIQPIEYVHANNIGYFEGTAIKYLSRWKDKGGIEDLKKAIHFIELLITLEQK